MNTSNSNLDQTAVNMTEAKNADDNLPSNPKAHQPQSEAERQQQLQNAHLENQDSRVKLPNHQTNNEPEHKEIGSMSSQGNDN